MQKFESWFDCLTLKILTQRGKIFLPIPVQYLLQESSEAEAVEPQRQPCPGVSPGSVLSVSQRLLPLKQLLSSRVYKPIRGARLWL